MGSVEIDVLGAEADDPDHQSSSWLVLLGKQDGLVIVLVCPLCVDYLLHVSFFLVTIH